VKTENAASVERFSNRVENYVKYRPGYPAEMFDCFRKELGLTVDSVIADIGSGTGLSAKPFLENGNVVYGIEPNAAMRAAAEDFLSSFENFQSIDGTSENTNLENASIDIVIAAQAFHWFEPEATRREFKRILKPGGYMCLIWNERQLDTTPFLIEYEGLLIKYASDYKEIRHENVTIEKIGSFFGREFESRTFANRQIFDFEGLKGRLLSSSYMPTASDAAFGALIEELKALFAKHEQDGKIAILYDTNIYFDRM